MIVVAFCKFVHVFHAVGCGVYTGRCNFQFHCHELLFIVVRSHYSLIVYTWFTKNVNLFILGMECHF